MKAGVVLAMLAAAASPTLRFRPYEETSTSMPFSDEVFDRHFKIGRSTRDKGDQMVVKITSCCASLELTMVASLGLTTFIRR